VDARAWAAAAARSVAALGCTLLAACAPVTTAVLLPEVSDRPTSVVVTRDAQVIVLEQPYDGVRNDATGLRAFKTTPQEVQSRYGSTLAALPARANRFTLYFVEGNEVLTDESKQIVDKTLAEIAARPVPDVLVVGHTDAVGTHAANDVLGLQRAEAIRAELIRLGLARESVQAISRGKREPAVPTADGVAEPRNRRVEIVVR